MRIKLIIGLGNPGKIYARTYHNAGKHAVEFLLNHQKTLTEPPRGSGKPYAIAASDAFMNDSGAFAARTMKKTGVRAGELLIIHDDSDILLGNYKFSYGRGSAGHKGVESVARALGTKNFWRLRIGVRPPEANGKRRKAGQFVLSRMTKAHENILDEAVHSAVPAIDGLKNRTGEKPNVSTIISSRGNVRGHPASKKK